MNKPRYIFQQFIQNSVFQHMLFWVSSFVALLHLFKMGEDITRLDVIYTFLFHISLFFGVCFNLCVLIPFFLKKERYFLYILLLIVIWLAIAELNVFTFNTLSDILFPSYLFVSEYSFSQLLLFALAYLALSTLLKLSKSWFLVTQMQQKVALLQQEQAEAELKVLKANINPHFLFNNLNTLYGLARKQSVKTPEYILKLSDLMRYMLYDTTEKNVALSKELDYISNYLALQELRYSDTTDINCSIVNNGKELMIAPFLLIPFVENSFKHGGVNDQKENSIWLKIVVDGERLQFFLRNTTAQQKSTRKNVGGFGIENVKNRLKKLYPDRYELEILEEQHQFSVKLIINLEEQHHE